MTARATILFGPPGGGKTRTARQSVEAILRDGGGAYALTTYDDFYGLAGDHGGQITCLHSDGNRAVRVYGPAPLLVFQLDREGAPRYHLGAVPPLDVAATRTLLVLDEAPHLLEMVPDTTTLVRQHLDAGGPLLACTQQELQQDQRLSPLLIALRARKAQISEYLVAQQ